MKNNFHLDFELFFKKSSVTRTSLFRLVELNFCLSLCFIWNYSFTTCTTEMLTIISNKSSFLIFLRLSIVYVFKKTRFSNHFFVFFRLLILINSLNLGSSSRFRMLFRQLFLINSLNSGFFSHFRMQFILLFSFNFLNSGSFNRLCIYFSCYFFLSPVLQ